MAKVFRFQNIITVVSLKNQKSPKLHKNKDKINVSYVDPNKLSDWSNGKINYSKTPESVSLSRKSPLSLSWQSNS